MNEVREYNEIIGKLDAANRQVADAEASLASIKEEMQRLGSLYASGSTSVVWQDVIDTSPFDTIKGLVKRYRNDLARRKDLEAQLIEAGLDNIIQRR